MTSSGVPDTTEPRYLPPPTEPPLRCEKAAEDRIADALDRLARAAERFATTYERQVRRG